MARQSGDLAAEISINTLLPLDGTGRPGQIDFTSLNLRSAQTRERLAKQLADSTDIQQPQWSEMLKYAVMRTVAEYRRPEPLVDLSTIQAPTKREFLLPYLLPKNEISHLFSDSEGGKSLFAIFEAILCKTGMCGPNGLQPKAVCNVLIVDYETHALEMARRLEWIARRLGVSCSQVHYIRNYRPLVVEIADIRRAVAQIKAGLVIVDSVTFCTDQKLVDPESAREVYNALRSLQTTVQTIGHITQWLGIGLRASLRAVRR